MATTTITRTPTRSAALAAAVRAEADRVGLSQGALAKLLQRSQQSISDRFTGRVPWTVDETARLEDVFGLEPGALLLAAVHAVTPNRDYGVLPGHVAPLAGVVGGARAWELAA